jgi:drug/metabolite transporter (DMT)-like permease
MARDKYTAKGAQALFASAFAYAFTPVLVREVAPMWGDKAQVAARWSLVFIILIVYGLFRNTKAKIPRSKLLYAISLGATFALTVLFFTFAVQKTTIANSLFTFYAANMIVSFLLGTLILKEAVSRSKILAIVLALAGLGLYSGELLVGSVGVIFAVIAGINEGASNVFRKKLSGVDRSALLRLQFGVGSVFTILVTLMSRDEIIRTASFRGTLLTVIFALILILAGNLLLYGYQHFDVNIGTVITASELVFGAILGLLLFHEVPAPHELLGGTLIFAGSILGSLDLGKLVRANSH